MEKEEKYWKKALAKREEKCATVSPAVSILVFIMSFLFRHSGFMVDARIHRGSASTMLVF